MMVRLTSIILICLLLLLGLTAQTPIHSVSAAPKSVLLYRYDDPAVRVTPLSAVDMEGQEYSFDRELPGLSTVRISPDGIRIAFEGLDGQVYVVDARGEVLFRGDFRTEGGPLNPLGWLESETLLLSRPAENQLTFYQLRLDHSEAALEAVERLNRGFIWNFEHAQGWGSVQHDAYNAFLFSPDFNFVLTPAELPTITGTTYQKYALTDAVALWNLTVPTEEPMEVIFNTIPWWRAYSSAPVWSHHTNEVVWGQFYERGDGSLGIYLLDAGNSDPPRLLANVECPAKEVCLPRHFAWSADDSQIAFWEAPSVPETGPSNRLVVADVESGERRVLLDREPLAGPIFWSPDDRFLAFVRGEEREPQQWLYRIMLVNVETGVEIRLKESSSSVALLGWMDRRMNG